MGGIIGVGVAEGQKGRRLERQKARKAERQKGRKAERHKAGGKAKIWQGWRVERLMKDSIS